MNLSLNIFQRKSLPVIQQASAAECGLACIAMVAGYHGLDIDIQSIRSRFATSLRGMNFNDISRVADKLGLSCRGIKVTRSAMKDIRLPAILHWRKSHFVVLKKVTQRGIVIHDPATGVMSVAWEELDDCFYGIAMELNPTPEFETGQSRANLTFRELFAGMSGIKSSLIKILLLSFALETFINLAPLYTQFIVDDVLVSSDTNLLSLLFIGYLFIVIFQMLASTLRSWFMVRIGLLLNGHIHTRIFSHLLKLPASYFEQRHVGDILSRFGSVNTIRQTLTAELVKTVVDTIMGSLVLVIMFIYSPSLSLIVLAFLGFYSLLRWLRYRPFKLATQEKIVAQAILDSHFLETIRGIRGVKIFNRQLIRREQWLKRLYNLLNKEIRLLYLEINYDQLGILITNIERGVVLYFGALLVIDGDMTIGYLLAFLAYKEQFVQRISNLIQNVIQFAMLRLHLERLSDITTTEPEHAEDLPYLVTDNIKPSITLENVSFRYSEYDPWIIKDFNCHVEDGEHVVITGRSGRGKTTLIKLILGLMPPEEGYVRIDNIPIQKLGEKYNTMVSAVMQDDTLYTGTILENISFFDETPDLAWAEECARIAEIHEEICQMKMAYNTLIGDIGTAISGGQKQRIMLARALYSKPKVLIMDEATSDLDVDLEMKIVENIKKVSITRISISHRSQTIAAADRQINLSLEQ